MRTPAQACAENDNCEAKNAFRSTPSLHDAFMSFVKARPQISKGGMSTSEPRRAAKPQPRSPRSLALEERRTRLRALFVDIARSFIGVPYGQKHHDPCHCSCEGCSTSGRQLYHSPLFLDCCGLVRRVVRALEAQIGFRLGPGNQAYQYDTLPIRLERASQLQPGDLVFYSGTYYDPCTRRHAFDLTHVEVFVGGSSGEATIGSRERYKWVMEYDSYRFRSQRWKLISYHFCSIDTWLDGICVPQHPELWRPRRLSLPQQQQQQQHQQHQQQSQQGQELQSREGSAPAGVSWATGQAVRQAWDTSKYSIFGRALGTHAPLGIGQ